MAIHDATSALGLERGRVRVVAYDDRWPALYEAEAARIAPGLAAAGSDVVLEHVGSTSVRGLAAKPIVDVLGGLARESGRAAAVAALRSAGYDHRGEQGIAGRDFFRRGEPRAYHLHLTLAGSAFWDDQRTFRDWLRARPDAAAEYAALKHALAARYPDDRESYIAGKTGFVERVLRVARSTTA